PPRALPSFPTRRSSDLYPGRLRFWNVGVPPSGPMDDLAFRLGNQIVGNTPGCAGLELTGKGPTLQFGVDCVIALTGAPMAAQLEDRKSTRLNSSHRTIS